MKYSANKEINKLIKKLICDGWQFRHGSKHGRLKHPSKKRTLTVPKSPSDYRCFYNFKSDLRKIC